MLVAGSVTAAAPAPAAGSSQDAGVAPSPGDGGVPHDAGPLAGDAGSAATAAVDPLAWTQARQRALNAEIAGLDREIAAIEALPADLVQPPAALADLFEVDASDAAAVQAHMAALEQVRQAHEAAAQELAAVESALASAWAEPEEARPGRRRRRPARSAEQVALDQARLEHVGLQRAVHARRSALARAQISYLARSQAARQEAQAREDALDREIEEKREAALALFRKAEAARRNARTERERARSQADALIGAEKERLRDVEARQAQFEAWLRDRQQALGSARNRVEHVQDGLDALPDADARHARVSAALKRVRVDAIGDLRDLLAGMPAVPAPDARESEALRDLSQVYAAERAMLEALRLQLEHRAATLRDEMHAIWRDRVELFHRQARALDRLRIGLLPRLSQARCAALLSPLDEGCAHALGGESAQAVLDTGYWLLRRSEQVRAGAVSYLDLATLGQALWWLFDIAVIFLGLRLCLRRWDGWMLRTVELIGTSMPLGPWTMFLARLADFARDFGPPLLVLGAVEIVYQQLGADAAPAEVRVAHILVFWITLFRAQMRLVERLAGHFDSRAAERAREASELDSPARNQDTGAPAARPAPVPPGRLVARVWRLVSGYLAVVVLLLELTDLAMGHGVLHGILARYAWWGAVLVGAGYLHVWRAAIAAVIAGRLPSHSALGRLVETRAAHPLGAVFVAVALGVLLARRLAGLARQNLAETETNKRLLAFLFRRRVERHAQENGRVLDKPHALPAEVLDQFPSGSLRPEDRPVKPAFLAEIKQAFAAWQEERVQGSVVLVGASGMGKSTALGMLEGELGAPVVYGAITTKHISPGSLVAALAELLLGPAGEQNEQNEQSEQNDQNEQGGQDEEARTAPEIRSEDELVDALRARAPGIIALDDCHDLFLRQVGGFEAWHAFTRIVNKSCDRVFWVLACNDAAWDYLRGIAGGVSYFRRVVRMPPWTDEELRRLILTRMRRAGYRPSFTDLLVTRIEGVETRAQIIRTAQGYFRLLWDFTDGNPRVATHFWLSSVVPDPERRRVRVQLFAAPRIAELEALSDDMAFVLTAVVEHENITVDELVAISNVPADFCRFALSYCREHGYLWQSLATGRIRLSTHWQQSIIRYLKRRHFLYS